MRTIVYLCFLLVAGCTTMNQMNSNMETTIVLMRENVQAIEESKQAIQENTKEIHRSTAAMENFQFVFPIFFSILLLIFIFMIFKIYQKMANLNKHQ